MDSIRLSIVFLLITLFYYSLADSPEIQKIAPEVECSSAGGHCVHSSKCPEDKVSMEADCPKQKNLGAVCCHSILDPNETECEKLAGECMDNCPSNLTVAQAQNCPKDKVCCTLV